MMKKTAVEDKSSFLSANDDFSWEEEQIVRNLFIGSNKIGNSFTDIEKEFEQSFNLISSKYIGTENLVLIRFLLKVYPPQ